MSAILEVKGLTKTFGGVNVNNNISLELHPHTITALVGENGAGKSTLCKMLTGVYHPDAGQIFMDGKEVHFAGPAESMAAGINMVYQERNVIGMYTGAENICLGEEQKKGLFVSPRKSAEIAYEVREKLGLKVPLDVPVSKLGAGEQQLIEIMRAFRTSPRVMILDEPTASLSKEEIQPFLDFVKRVRDEMDIAIVFISHHLEEVFEISDQVVVLTDGNMIINRPVDQVTEDECVAAMLRSDKVTPIEVVERDVITGKEPLLKVERGVYDGKEHDIQFEVYRGEVVGFYGIVGSGRTECLETIYGLRNAKERSFVFDGETITKCKPLDMLKRGMIMTAEKRADGLFRGLSLTDNICNLFLDELLKDKVMKVIDRKKAADFTLEVLTEAEVKYNTPAQAVASLSGGNQQKVAIGRSIALQNIKMLILDEPTTGIDVGAKRGIYRRVRALAEEKDLGIVCISSELDELLSIADRIYVMANGNVVDCFKRADFNKLNILETAVRGRKL